MTDEPTTFETKFISKAEAVFPWKDTETEAMGWVVLDTITNGISGGGIFMHPNATLQEVEDIAANMTKKFTVTDPMIGGAKGGIRFSPTDPRANSVIQRFIAANKSLLENIWVTGGDLGVDDAWVEKCVQKETSLVTCQATLGRKVAQATQLQDLSTQLRDLLSYPASPYFPLVEGSVGYGLTASVEFVIDVNLLNKKPEIKKNQFRIMIMGFGAVGSSLAYYLTKRKIGTVVGICDKDGFVIAENGLPVEDFLKLRKEKVEELRKNNAGAEQVIESSKNLIMHLQDGETMYKITRRNTKWWSNEHFLTYFLQSGKSDIFCPCASRYCITPKIANLLVKQGYRFVVSGANNPLGNPDSKSENIDGQILDLFEKANICFVPDYVSNSGTAQLFHRGLSIPFNMKDDDLAEKVLDACSTPIRNFLNEAFSLVTKDIPVYHRPFHLPQLIQGCKQLTETRLRHPLRFGSHVVTTKEEKDKDKDKDVKNKKLVTFGASRYGLPPPTVSCQLSLEEKHSQILSLGEECIEASELYNLLQNCPNPVAYDGFEPSGKSIHIAQGLLKSVIVNKMTECGFTFLFWIADFFAYLNMKMGGDLEKIQTLGRYYIEVWKACGMKMDRVRFLWASKEISNHHEEYFDLIMKISTRFSLKRIQKCCTIMGKTESDALQSSQILYPIMQCADIFFLGVDVCQLGTNSLLFFFILLLFFFILCYYSSLLFLIYHLLLFFFIICYLSFILYYYLFFVIIYSLLFFRQ